MTPAINDLPDKTAHSLERWHNIIATRDMNDLRDLIHPDAVFRSPVVHKPYQGRDVLVLALSTVIDVFENFTYHRSFASADGKDVVLEFSANVGDRDLKGADFIKFDDDGKIVEFEVMVRPMSGLTALGEEMGKRVGAIMATYKN